MEFEFWWLLGIPVFFGLGWIAARVDINQLLSESRTLPRGYFKGLNFLLNEQPDKAIDAFIEIVKLDPETVELHFALGNLFRRRGETERAIRVHQNLLARPDLPAEHHGHALYELGQDYLKAGLLDRAEESFNRLIDTQYSAQAGRALLEIYQREKEWERAISAAEILQATGAGGRQREIAQFYCELAADELVRTNTEAAMALLEKALAADRKSVRATMLMGDALRAQGDIEGALETWRRVEHQSVPHTALVAQRLMDGYVAVGRVQEGINLLRAYLAEAPSIDLLEVVFKAVLEVDGVDAANLLVSDELRRTPTLLALDKFLEARMMNAPQTARSELSVVKTLVHGYTQKLARYQCSHCGFKARQFYWQCPGCSRWETYPPRRTEELNVMN
ncbi:lipopolysaccharide assembly protein LapB [Herbaspirillum seropedicae]|uniref:Lipopolysaccharide assembly protein B n=2 Tax=Herbaspirillum seropedicae TaxID=964 RepID=D8IR38_HERSS|nr:lipopolysaccharide assembly protein LapB [Herbaspirillum seropedicae]ADJ65164.1 N-acetylglucosaminyl transferase protein [Herbaspirillum seropedicae SmR1]AKN67028.1 N-acetylglucosaminyl transferase [Herbaspirillum seropedicae]AON56054.1 N-acetylglucosaminyl transferase [Herbaspirillum seropedicae]MDR6395440.1 lipopolysaccharide biosynthesis regulator YciM [Herbaspirillum seropedicae]NQE30372.1 N-acetylglucosaminyl transferase [Herbaspirillum seropedicae]